MPSSSTVSTVGDDRAKHAQNGKKGRKLRVCGVASYGAKGSCFRPWLKCVASKLPFIFLLQICGIKTCPFLPCSEDGASKTPSGKDYCHFYPLLQGQTCFFCLRGICNKFINDVGSPQVLVF